VSQLHSASEKDAILRNAFENLRSRGISSDWANSNQPHSALRQECQRLMEDQRFVNELAGYLRSRTIVRRSIEMFFTQIAMSARANWRDAPPSMRPVVARGWFLGRWLPTFLIIDGPIGRFVCHRASPLHSYLDSKYPLLLAARAFIGERLFLQVRNGFAHWGFDWEVVGPDSYIVIYNWEQDLPIVKLHQREADAFHIAAFALVEILDEIVISQRQMENSPNESRDDRPASELSAVQRADLMRRDAELDANPEITLSWEQVRASIEGRK
jgi:hypothetical protein